MEVGRSLMDEDSSVLHHVSWMPDASWSLDVKGQM